MVVPDVIKKLAPGIYKTAMRAEQLQNVKPIMAYWCNYQVTKHIVDNMDAEKESNKAKLKKLKDRNNADPDNEDVQMVYTWTDDEEITDYANDTMKWLEAFKKTHDEEKAVMEDEIAQLYVEQFAQETLDRAQRVVDANKVTATTANTFDAAATFFSLYKNWDDPPDPETLRKIKYAKWNAQRILRACKKGLDPNESNPKPEELPQDLPMPDYGFAQDGAIAPGLEPPGAPADAPRPVTIEEGPDDSEQYTRRDSAGVSLPHSPASSAGGTAGGTSGATNSMAGVQDPHHLPSVPSHVADVPTFVDPASPTLPSLTPGTAPAGMFDTPPLSLPSAPSGPSSYEQIPPSNPPTFAPSSHSTAAVASPSSPSAYSGYGAPAPQSHTSPAGYPPATSYSHAAPQQSAPLAQPEYSYSQPPRALPPKAKVDDAAIAAAQKHAKWAISALNFEDVETAKRELRRALQQLGES